MRLLDDSVGVDMLTEVKDFVRRGPVAHTLERAMMRERRKN
jgi:hypothetical protein